MPLMCSNSCVVGLPEMWPGDQFHTFIKGAPLLYCRVTGQLLFEQIHTSPVIVHVVLLSRARFNSNLVVHSLSQSLFAAEIFFSGRTETWPSRN
jgi:hypothetical protein